MKVVLLLLIIGFFNFTNSNEIKFLESKGLLEISKFNQDVINFARDHAYPTSQKRCAEFVRKAIESTGIIIDRKPDAYLYGENLIKVGYKSASCTGEPGMIYVIDRTPIHTSGHIEIAGDDGFFYSDFKQTTNCPYSDGCASVKCYKHD